MSGFFDTLIVHGLQIGCPLFGVYSLLSMLSHRRSARLIEDTPTARVRSAAQGYTELIGTAKAHEGKLHRAPFSREMCVWHDSILYESASLKSVPKQWRDTSSDPFELEDETGSCVIYHESADFDPLVQRTAYDYDAVIDPDDMLNERNNGNDYTFVERIIRPGDPLYVLGEFHTKKQRVEVKTAGPLMWPPDPATESWIREHAVFTIRKPRQKKRPFLISGFPQTHLADRYRRKAVNQQNLAIVSAFASVMLWFL